MKKLKTDINFFEAQRQAEKESRPQADSGRRTAAVVLAGAALVALGLLAVGAFRASRALDAQIAEAQSYVQDEANQTSAAAAQTAADEADSLRAYNERCLKYHTYLQQTDRLGAGHFALVNGQKPASTTVTAYSYASGALTVSCLTPDKDEPAAFARALTDSGSFSKVQYGGFTSTQTDGATVYSFTITCVFADMM